MSDDTPQPTSPELPRLPVVFRPTRNRAVLLSAALALFAVLLVVPLSLAIGLRDRLTFVGTGVVLALVLLWLSRPKVVAAPNGVTVVNLATKRRLDWAQVLRVNLRSGDPWVYLDLADGTSLPAMGIQPGIARNQAIRDARTLRALAETYGSGSTTA